MFFGRHYSTEAMVMRSSVNQSLNYCNPVIDASFADPFVFKADGWYWAVGTSGSERSLFPMMRSRNLIEWVRCGPSLIPPSPDLGTDFWAPEVAFDGSRFYMYYSVGFRDKNHRLRVAASEGPEGPYVDLDIDLVDPSRIPFAIDASPFRDVDGGWYLFYARDFLTADGESRTGTAVVVDRLESMTRLAGEERIVWRPTKDWQRFTNERQIYGGKYDWHTLEGACTVLHEGRYYCFFSGGRWENDSYGVDYAEADHPLGPWRGGGEEFPRVLQSVAGKVIGPGHNSIVRAPDGSTDLIVYHAWDPAMTARRMCIDRLVWTADGPRCAGPTWTPQTL